MKDFTMFVNENRDRNYVIFNSYCNKYFNKNKNAFLSWLNKYCINKSVIYIDLNDNEIDRNFITSYFDFDSHLNIKINMTSGQHGSPKGLIFLDFIPIPKKYKMLRNLELDPHDEEDWGFEEIIQDEV